MAPTKVLKVFEEGTFGAALVEEEGRLLVLKYPPSKSGWRALLAYAGYSWPLQNLLPTERAFVYSASIEERLQKEARTLELWANAGIPAPNVCKLSGELIALEYIPNTVSFRKLLSGRLDLEAFDKLMEVYSQIRDLAKQKRDPDYLHSDPMFSNFLYDTENDRVIAVDPGVVLNPQFDFDTLDAYVLDRTLMVIANQNLPDSDIGKYVRRFKDQMSDEDVTRVVSIPHVIPVVADAYFSVRNWTAAKVKNRQMVDNLVAIRTYCKNYHAFIEDILLE
jgi:tRNA A-37 threonylcarbamoyl transferase component Bud32